MTTPAAAPSASPPSNAPTPRGTPRTAAPVAIIDWAALAHVVSRPLGIDCPDTRGLPKRAARPRSKMLPVMLKAGSCSPRQYPSRGLALRSPRDATLAVQAARAKGWPAHVIAAGGTPRAERKGQDIPVLIATYAEDSAVVQTPAGAGSSVLGARQEALGAPNPEATLHVPRHTAPAPADSDRRRRTRAATTLLNPHVWAAASALRPSSAARPTTPAWGAAVAEAGEGHTLRPEYCFPVVECGEVVRGTRGALANQCYRRYRCSVCAAHNAAACRAPEMFRPQRRPMWIEVPVYSGEGELSSRPGPFIARRADHFAAHAHGTSAHAVFASALRGSSDVCAALRAVEAAAERLDTFVVQPSHAMTRPPTQLHTQPPILPPAQALGRQIQSPAGHLSAAQWEAPWGEARGADALVAPCPTAGLSLASLRTGSGLSPRNQRRSATPLHRVQRLGGDVDACASNGARHMLSTPTGARSDMYEPHAPPQRADRQSHGQRTRPLPKVAAPSPRAHLGYMGATNPDSDSELETFRPPTPPSCTAPIAASRRRELAYAVALCY
jgi:hypothetical protein